MRRATSRIHRALALALAPLPFAAACSSSTQASAPVGPVYTFDGGADVATDHPPDASAPDALSAPDAPLADATLDAPVDAATPPVDAAVDAPTDASTLADAAPDASPTDAPAADASVCPGGTGLLALVGGSSTLAFAATSTNGAPWSLTSLTATGVSVGSKPAVAPFGGGFLGVFPTANADVVLSTLYTSTGTPGWKAAAPIPALAGSDASATASGALALAPLGTSAELVYAGSNFKFYHGAFTGTPPAWGPASDPVGGAGNAQDYGPSAPSAAAVGSTLYAAYDGGNNGLYVDSWTASGGWAGAVGITGAGVGAVPPTLVALTGGAADLMLVFEQKGSNLLSSVVHTPGGGAGAWSAPVTVDANASSVTAVSVAPLASGGAVLVYQGVSDSLPYASIYTPGATPSWTAPSLVYANAIPLSSPPSVASGACGVDAIAAFVQPVGVEVVTLKAGVWSAPSLVSGTAQMTYATLAAAP